MRRLACSGCIIARSAAPAIRRTLRNDPYQKDVIRAVLTVPLAVSVVALAIAPRPANAQQSAWTVGNPAYTMDAAGSVTDADGASGGEDGARLGSRGRATAT